MRHEDAVEGQIAERYVLGELNLAEREEFEEHFFECSICADWVRSAARFVDSATVIAREDLPQQVPQENIPVRAAGANAPKLSLLDRLRASFSWPLVASHACLILVILFLAGALINTRQQLTVANLPQVLSSLTLVSGTRSATPKSIVVPATARSFELIIDMSGIEQNQTYQFQVFAPNGTVVSSGNFAVPVDVGPIHLLLPASRFASGVYTLQWEAANQTQPQTFQFQVLKTGVDK